MKCSIFNKSILYWLGIAFSALIFFQQDSIIWRGIIIVYLMLFACGAVLTQLQNRGNVKFLPRELSSPKVMEWLDTSFSILIFVYLIVYSPDGAFNIYHPDIFIYGIAVITAVSIVDRLADKDYFTAGGYFVVTSWMGLFLLLHAIYIEQGYIAAVACVYYSLEALSILFLLFRTFVSFPTQEVVATIALICFAAKDIYLCQNLPHKINFFTTIPCMSQ